MTDFAYSPDDVVLTVGPVVVDGYGQDTFFSGSFDEPLYNSSVGALGDVTIVRNFNRMVTATITLKQQSLSNTGLSNLIRAQEAGFPTTFPFSLVDARTGTTIIAANCYFENQPEVTFAKDVGTREYTIHLLRGDFTVAGGPAIT